MKPQNVKIDLIVLDAGTQRRPLDNNLVERYEGLIRDKVTLPPVEIIRSGTDYYLWDGFHRTEAASRAGKTYMRAYVTEGTLDDAIWQSFGANSKHGTPMKWGVKKKIIQTILSDIRWAKISQAKIAEHVGVTKQYVGQIKAAMYEANTAAQAKKKPADDAETQKRGKLSLPIEPPAPQRAETVETTSARGKKYEQKSQTAPPAEVKDKCGNIIPKDLLAKWEDAERMKPYLNSLAKLKKDILQHVKDRDSFVEHLRKKNFTEACDHLKQAMLLTVPHCICPICGGKSSDTCKMCSGRGLISKHAYDTQIPKESKWTTK